MMPSLIYSNYFFQLTRTMPSILSLFLFAILLAANIQAAIIALSSSGTRVPVKMATITSVSSLGSPSQKLKALGVPGYSYQYSYNTLAVAGWTCQGVVEKSPLSYWINSSKWASLSEKEIKQKYVQRNISVLVNLFGQNQLPIAANQSASVCAQNLKTFLQGHLFDGVNIDFRDRNAVTAGLALPWLTQFLLALTNQYRATITVAAELLDPQLGPDLAALQKALGSWIPFWVIRHNVTSYITLYDGGIASVSQLVKRGIPVEKIVLETPSQPWQEGFSNGYRLLSWARRALNAIGWSAGFSVRPFAGSEAENYLSVLNSGRSTLPVASTTLDGVNFWWPPEKTVGDLGVPSFSPNQDYNHLVLGTWTCQNGAFDVAKLWSQASYYLSNKFGETTLQIQTFLKELYLTHKKQVVVKAFGRAESPTSAKLEPKICARKLASFVLVNQLDGVQVHYQDNDAFNAGSAEQWLVTFAQALRELLPFHVVSHAIEDRYLHPTSLKGGSYSAVIKQVGPLLDFYPVVYYGEQHTNFNTYSELFVDSGDQIPESSISQLVKRGFQLNKIVVAKPVALYDAQGAGFVEAPGLRPLFLQANQQLGWRAGIAYSTYLKDQDGNILRQLFRGKPKGPIYSSYLNNVNTWWPPTATLAEMGAPTLAPPNKYNHLALAFWTCEAPKAMAKLYNDPLTYFGEELGKNKTSAQKYIHSLYSKGGVSLMVSAFGDTEFPASAGFDPIDCAHKLIDYVRENGLDGVDVDFQDSEAFRNGTGEPWLGVFTRELRMGLPFHLISHAPQAPYFAANFSSKGAYYSLKDVFSNLVDFYNIQYYNQGNTTYDTYSGLFLDSGILNPNNAVYQLIGQGIRPEQIVLGKPVTKADAYNSGWVSSEAMNKFLLQSVSDSRNGGWTPNLMFWQFLSDLNGTVLATAIKGI